VDRRPWPYCGVIKQESHPLPPALVAEFLHTYVSRETGASIKPLRFFWAYSDQVREVVASVISETSVRLLPSVAPRVEIQTSTLVTGAGVPS
jgi:hypothetical protein